METSDWVSSLEEILEISCRQQDKSRIVQEIFKGILSPEISITRNQTIEIPENYAICIGGASKLYKIFSSSNLFHSLPSFFKKSILDILWILLHRSIYDVVRFRCFEDNNLGFIALLLKLLTFDGDASDVLINKRIIRLIGIVSVSGISPQDLRAYLYLLRKPSLYSISLLQSLKMMNKIEEGIVKASPISFFNFSGHEQGLTIDPRIFPFQKEYQILFWFRFESSLDEEFVKRSHLISLLNGNLGLDVYLEKNVVCVKVANSSSEHTTLECGDYPLTAGVWYHLCITHTKPRMSLFAKHELSVHLDHQPVFQDVMRFPSASAIGVMSNASIGNAFDGQMGPIYLLLEPLPPLAVQLIARQDAGKAIDEIPSGYPLDFLPNLTTSDKKTIPFTSKIYSVYHPLRCNGDILLDVHNNHHCTIGPLTRCWTVTSVRETLVSLGGITCFLPLLPKLLIENEDLRDEIFQKSSQLNIQMTRNRSNSIQKSYLAKSASHGVAGLMSNGVGLGTSLLQTITDNELESIFSNQTLSYIEGTVDELQEDKPIGLILSIIAQSIKGHLVNQTNFLFGGGVEMIQYALTGMPRGAYILKQEEESCILGLLQLRSACNDLIELDAILTKRLLCNFQIWSNASFKLQSSLFSVILANIKAQPEVFLSIVGIQIFLDAIALYYLHIVEDPQKPQPSAEGMKSPSDPSEPLPCVLEVLESNSSSDQEDVTVSASPARFHQSVDLTTTPTIRPHTLNPARSFRKSVHRRMSQIDPEIDPNLLLISAPSDSIKLPTTPKVSNEVDLRSAFKKESSRSLSCKFDSSSQSFRNVDTDSDDSQSEENSTILSLDNSNMSQQSLNALLNDPTVGEARTRLTQDQRKVLRQSLQAVVMILITQSPNISEIKPLISFLCQCSDDVVLEESLQLLLCLLIKDTHRRIATVLTEIFKGTEEFASFVICRFVQSPYEPLRCVAISLLIHFYLRVETMSPTIVNSYPKKKKNSKLLRAREKYASMIEGQGLDRFQACGGFALISLFLNENKLKSTDLTYVALMDMILTTSDADKHISPTYRNFYYDYCVTTSARTEIGKPNMSSHHSSHLALESGSNLIDENTEVRNIAALPLFFQSLPKLPSVVQERVYCDLLGLLKHNSKNRDLFCQDLNWHICLYDLVGQLMAVTEGCTTQLHQSDIVSDLQSWALFQNPGEEDAISALFSRNNGVVLDAMTKSRIGIFPRQLMFDLPRSMSPIQSHQRKQSSPIPHNSQASHSLSTLDMWFDIGMKIYATLLLHALDYKNGYKEIEKTISQSFDSSHGVAVSLAVFSHLLNEITFTIQSKYKDAQKKSKTGGNTEETISASNQLDNMLSVMVMLSIHFVEDDSIVGLGISDFIFAKRRLELLEETKRNLLAESVALATSSPREPCPYQCNDAHHQAVCVLANDLCRCGHSRSLHPLSIASAKSLSELVEEKLAQEIGSGVLISRVGSGFDGPSSSSSAENVVYTTLTKSETTSSSSHSWIDVRGTDMRPQSQDSSRPLSRTFSKRKFQVEEVLNPLERGYEVPRGRMVVILQALRYFDVFFWHSPTRLRNEHLLNFTSNLSSNRTALENQKKPRNSNNSSSSGNNKVILPMSLYNSLLRMTLYVTHNLSPFTQLAVTNIKRIHILLKNVEKILPESCPRNEWVMVVIAHMIAALHRIHQSFHRLYDILGLTYQTELISDGPLDHSQKQIEMKKFHQIEENDKVFYEFIEEADTVSTLNHIFSSPAGRQLIEYICGCIDVLVTLYNTQRELIATVMGDRGFMAFTLIIEKHEKLLAKFPTLRSAARARSVSKDVRERLNSGGSTLRRNSLSRRESVESSEDSPVSPEHRRHSLSTDDERLRTFSLSEDMGGGGGGGGDESLKICEGAIRALKWLRDPFIRMNLMTGESMIRYVLAVEQYEKYHVKGFYEEMVSAKDQFFENKNLRVQYVDEMNELMELGDEMITVISEQENRRESHDRIMNEVFNKASAMYWNDCLRDFDEEWSPWTSSLKDKSQYIISLHRDRIGRRMVMKRGSEVYDHSDAAYWGGRGREQSEYDQLLDSNAETGTASSTGSLPEAAASTSSTSFLKNTLEITRPKMSRLRSENDWDEKEGGSDGDGDDVDVDIEETSVPIHSKPDKGLVRFPFQQVEKKKPLWASTFVWQSDEREVFTVDVTQIMTEQALSGTLLLTNKSLYFHPKKRIGGFATNPDEFHNKRWKLEKLVEVYGRRYLLQNCGVELFFLDSPEFFIAFNTTHELHKFFRFLRKLMNKNLITGSSLSPMHIYQISPWTELWKKRLISNYEYLMRLNQIGGRSYNDITQYPVMPWVLKDYQSTQLDLNNEEIYRDLSKPIGALNEQRLREILERYKSFGDDYDMPGFMYGSHYSSAGVILHFLVRQEPFTSMAITLQAGRFDCPDRLFFNIKETWKCCNTSLSDVKELLPELFFLPEMFINTNTLPLGELQDDRGVVNHVLLPPWCQSNPYEFIRLHREALESDYVSDHLHEWIDLIFGFKQTGKAAVDACNVFHYLTYENAIDIESIQDPLTKNATKAQVTHFGQTPSQLLTKEHPKRLPKEECQLPFTTNFKTLPKLRCFTPSKQFCSPVPGSPGGDQQQHGAIVRIQGNQEKLLVFHSDFTIATYRWNTYPDSSAEGGYPFTLKPDKIKSFPFSPLMVFPYTSTSSLNEQRLRDIRLDEATAAANASTTSYFGLFTLSNSGSSPTRTPTKTSPDTPPSVPPSPSLTVTAALFPRVDDSPEEAIEEAPVPSHQPQSLMKLVQDKRIQKKNVIFRLAESTSYDRLLTCGYWDGHLKAHGLDTFREIATSPGGHIGGINCVDMSDEEKALVITGGDDCTCRVWVLENPALVASLTVDQEMHSHILNTATDSSSISSASSPTSATNTATTTTTATTALSGNSMSALENKFGNPGSLKMIHVLWGHNSPVTALSYSNFHDLILSGSESGLLCVHTARKGEYIRSIYSLMAAQDQPLADLRPFCQGEGCAIDQVEISTSGYLYAYCATNLTLSVFWINGQFLHRVTLATRMECLLLNSAGSMLFCGGSDGRIVIRQAWDLQEVETSIHLPDHGAITSMILQADEYFLIVGTEDGMLHVCTDPDSRWKPMTSGGLLLKNPLF